MTDYRVRVGSERRGFGPTAILLNRLCQFGAGVIVGVACIHAGRHQGGKEDVLVIRRLELVGPNGSVRGSWAADETGVALTFNDAAGRSPRLVVRLDDPSAQDAGYRAGITLHDRVGTQALELVVDHDEHGTAMPRVAATLPGCKTPLMSLGCGVSSLGAGAGMLFCALDGSRVIEIGSGSTTREPYVVIDPVEHSTDIPSGASVGSVFGVQTRENGEIAMTLIGVRGERARLGVGDGDAIELVISDQSGKERVRWP